MRYLVIMLAALAVMAGSAMAQGVQLSTAYNFPLLPGTAEDSVLYGLGSIRGMWFDDDVDGDGKSEMVLSNYADAGHVHVFETVGNDSIRLVWSSPAVASGGGVSTPRFPIFGDLDNDGKKEVIYQSNDNGIYIFEWDGVTGSDNYGTIPSQIIGTPFLSSANGNCEYMEVTDVDGDGANELLVAYNSSASADDRYYIISAIGSWSTDNPGFSSFNVEYQGIRTDADWAARGSGGSPYAMISANFDGTGNPEILIHNWNIKNVFPMRVTAADTYELSDTTGGKGNILLGHLGNDYVALFGGMAYDIDDDGRQEVYLPTYVGSIGGPGEGVVHMIYYDAGSNTAQIDSSNVFELNLSSLTFGSSTLARTIFGYGYGDYDGDGNKNLYFSTTYPFNLVTAEFSGGDKTNLANWSFEVLYPGDSTIVSSMVITDSSGTVDTSRTVNTAFAGKIFARNTDFDKDGYEDMLLPYQAYSDSVSVTKYTWNGSAYDTLKYKVVNPKRWGFRIIESTTFTTGVEAKDMTIIMPDEYRLEQNYPNPFNPSTTISFYLPIKDVVSVQIYDIVGKEVRTLVNHQEYPSGTSQITWDGRTNAGTPAASGTYFYSLIYGNFKQTKKMMLLK